MIWLNKQGHWAVLRDVCPHRLVPLSEGRIDEQGRMECGYHGAAAHLAVHVLLSSPRLLPQHWSLDHHIPKYPAGWAFNASGACEAIPQGGDPASARACAVSYPCTERQDLLWVKLTPQPLASATNGNQPSAADTSDIPIIPEVEVSRSCIVWTAVPCALSRGRPADACALSYAMAHVLLRNSPEHVQTPGSGWDSKVSSNTFRDFPYDYATLVENLLDVGHVSPRALLLWQNTLHTTNMP